MINHYLRRSIRALIPVALSMLASDAHTQQRSISGAEAAYLQAQQGKPLPQKPGSPNPPKRTWVPPASCYWLSPREVSCKDPARTVTVLMYSPVLIPPDPPLSPVREASRRCEEIVAGIWNRYVQANVCKPEFGPNRMDAMAKDMVEFTIMAAICREPKPPRTIEELFTQNLDNQWNCFLDKTCTVKPTK